MSDVVEVDKRIVADGKIRHLAVTKIRLFDSDSDGGCNLRWWYRDVQGRKEEERKWHDTGDSVDQQVAFFLNTGTNVLGRIALAGKDFILPQPGNDLLLQWGLNDKPRPYDEKKKRFKSHFPAEESKLHAAGIPLIGFADIINGRGQYLVPVDAQGLPSDDAELAYGDKVALVDEPEAVEVADVKSTKNFTYTKKHRELTADIQMMGYGMFVAQTVPEAKYARLSHLAFLTEGSPRAIKRSILVPIAQVKDYWSRTVEPIAEKMKAVATITRADEVEGNLSACNTFGGCSHRKYCCKYNNTNPLKRFSMGLLKNRTTPPAPNGAPPAPPNGAPPAQNFAPPPMSAPPVAAPGSQAFPLPALQVPVAPAQTMAIPQPPAPPPPQAAPPPPPPQPAPPPPPQPQVMQGKWVTAKEAVQGQKYILPPTNVLTMYLASTGGQQSFLPVDASGQAGGTPIKLPYEANVFELPVEEAPAPAAPTPAPAAITAPSFAPGAGTAPPAAATAAKRTRRTKAEIEAARAAEAAQTGAAPAADSAEGITLFVNALPNSGFVDLAGYVSEVTKDMEEVYSVPDVRAVMDDKSPIAFGRWKGVLAGLVKQNPPPPGVYVAFTKGSELAEIVVEALSGLCGAGQLVRGV